MISQIHNIIKTRSRQIKDLNRRFLRTGENIKGWKVENVKEIPEFDINATTLQHKSGSQLIYIKRADPNATFSVGFRTVPKDSTGLPHILEHTVLCGSTQYPCRDPFFKMCNRSLATFMNAMTAPDYTCYLFSSQNSKDLHNLQSVYLDAVFKPKLSRLDFKQEGWRLEHENPEDSSSPILLKGVVFNEMKGVFSDNQTLYGKALLNELLPSHTYGVCSGGLPLDIPKLCHNDLVQFHKDHYTPGNAKFFIYGDLPLEEYLGKIESYLSTDAKATPEVPSEPKWTNPRRKHISCRLDPLAADPEKQSCITSSFLCCDIRDVQEVFNLQVLVELLVVGPNASFYRTLVEPGIGAGLAPTTGYESQTKDTFFSVGLQGVAPKDFEKVEKVIKDTFQEIVKNGFTSERIEAVLHGIELNVKHQSSNFGLSILFSIHSLWNHHGDVLTAMGIEKQVSHFRQQLKSDPKFLQKMVEKYFVKNSHQLVLTMSPDANFESEQKKAEDKLLSEKLAKLTNEDRKKIYEEGLELLNSQKEDNKDILPTLHLSDIPRTTKKIDAISKTVGTVPISYFPQPTNGVTYFRAVLATDDLDSDLQAYLPVFAHVATKMGTNNKTFRELDQAVSLVSGGLGAGCHVTNGVKDYGYESSLTLGSHCLTRNDTPMYQLWEEVLRDGNLNDTARFETLIKNLAANMVNSITSSGHHYAMLGASALVSQSSALQERQSGLAFITLLKQLASSDPAQGLATVRKVRDALANAPLRCAINALPGTDIKPLESFVKNLNVQGRECKLVQSQNNAQDSNGSLHVLPFDVSYASKATLTVPYTHTDFAPLRILSGLLSNKYLHPEIREKGGAYGGGANLATSGLFRFFSYRDPAPSNSLRVFDNANDWLRKNPPKGQDLEEAKLGVFQSVDAPVAPGDRGVLRFLHGITDEMVDEHRRCLLDVTAEDLLRVAETYLNKPAGRCVLGPTSEELLKYEQCRWKVIEL